MAPAKVDPDDDQGSPGRSREYQTARRTWSRRSRRRTSWRWRPSSTRPTPGQGRTRGQWELFLGRLFSKAFVFCCSCFLLVQNFISWILDTMVCTTRSDQDIYCRNRFLSNPFHYYPDHPINEQKSNQEGWLLNWHLPYGWMLGFWNCFSHPLNLSKSIKDQLD